MDSASSPCFNASTAGFFFILIFSWYLLRRLRPGCSEGKAPEAAGGWPLIGHLHLLGGSQLPHQTLAAMADKYGPVFRIRAGVHEVLVISSWEVAKECFTTHDAVVSSRPKVLCGEHLGYNYASFSFSPYGYYWRNMRKLIASEILSNSRLELLRHVRESEVKSSLKELYQLWGKREKSSGEVPVEMQRWIGEININVFLMMVCGKKYSGSTANRDERELRRCRSAIREFFRLSGLFLIGDAIPYLRWLDLGGHVKAMKEAAKELDSIASEWLDEHRRKKVSGKDNDGAQDFMDVLLSILSGMDLAGYDSDTAIKATSMAIIMAGTDTITVALIWALCLLLNNKQSLRRAKEELDRHVGKERLVEEADISKLVYLQAIFKESMRLYPPAPLSGFRIFTQDCTVGGYHVPVGTQLITNLWKIQTDPRVWSEPLEFKPERFLDAHKHIDVKGHHFELIPFGSGRRACPGIGFGVQMAQLMLASLIQAFEISTPSDEPVDMSASFGLTNSKTTPLEVLVRPRLPPPQLCRDEGKCFMCEARVTMIAAFCGLRQSCQCSRNSFCCIAPTISKKTKARCRFIA